MTRLSSDPATAKKHFARILDVSSRPLSVSRADYWLGRAAEKQGRRSEAVTYYKRAGQHPTTYYGQLALASLGVKTLPIAPQPKADAATRARFESRELVQVIKRLDAANRGDRNDIYRKMDRWLRRENLPIEGPYVLAPNHYSEFDPVIIAVATWRCSHAFQ